MKHLRTLSALIGLMSGAIATQIAFAQECSESIEASTPVERFAFVTDHLVEDQITGLTWHRCPIGYTIQPGVAETRLDDQCIESEQAQFDWESAFAETAAAGGANPARLPNVKEFMSIVENQCHGPAVNLEVFPDTPVTGRFLTTSNNSLGDIYVVQSVDGQITEQDPTDNGVLFHLRVIQE